MTYLYHILNFLFLPIYLILFIFRISQRKEDVKRINERFAVGNIIRDKKNDTLIWLHAASIGESIIALTLVENINKLWHQKQRVTRYLKFLVTSGTIPSANLLQQKLPKNAIHQFIPLDNIIFVKNFFKKWQPDLGIFIEAELWPGLISHGCKYCKLLLLNARLSDKSFHSWKKASPFFRTIINKFSQIIVQSHTDFQKFIQLGITNNIINLGNIKFANKQLTVDKAELSILAKYMDDRKVIVFASTHHEDEQILLQIIKPIKRQYPNCYFILIPRHPERKSDIGKMCNNLELTYSLKSQYNLPVITDDVYIVDTFGELGLFFSLAYITFIGGSFGQGGHNILEPAHFSNYIIFGPDMSNFADMASSMLNFKAATQIQNKDNLLNIINYLLSEDGIKEVKIYQNNALIFVNKVQQVLDDYLYIIEQYLGEKTVK